jgi:hypothetical protein
VSWRYTHPYTHACALPQILLQPDTGAERSIRAELQKDIKAESLMVIKLADEQRIDLEWPEAIEIAKEQVL